MLNRKLEEQVNCDLATFGGKQQDYQIIKQIKSKWAYEATP